MNLELTTYKNYKELCVAMDWSISGGNTKKSQLKDLESYCSYHKEGNKFIIDKIYQQQKEKLDNRKKYGEENPRWEDYEQLKISNEENNNIGIYYILKNNDIYIGSTISGFRKRFQDHYYGYDELMKHTYEMLQNGATFNILYDMTGILDETLIRQIEQEYIDYFKNYTNYNVINIKEQTYSIQKKNEIKYRTIKIKVSELDYEKTIQFLIESGLYNKEEK